MLPERPSPLVWFRRLFPGNPVEEPARRLYGAIVGQARHPAFYGVCGVPDTVDGRFELLMLHLFLVLRRLGADSGARDLAQTLVDLTFFDLDQSIRKSGVGDLGAGPRLNRMVQAYFGRAAAYKRGLEVEDGGAALRGAIRRNLFGTLAEAPEGSLESLAIYIAEQDRLLAEGSDEALAAGEVTFGAPPGA